MAAPCYLPGPLASPSPGLTLEPVVRQSTVLPSPRVTSWSLSIQWEQARNKDDVVTCIGAILSVRFALGKGTYALSKPCDCKELPTPVSAGCDAHSHHPGYPTRLQGCPEGLMTPRRDLTAFSCP